MLKRLLQRDKENKLDSQQALEKHSQQLLQRAEEARQAEKPVQPSKRTPVDDVGGSRLRAEMLPTGSNFLAHLQWWAAHFFTRFRILMALSIIGVGFLGWYFSKGPGQPALEQMLVSLANRLPAATATATSQPPTPIPPTLTPSPTRRPTATLRPTSTPLPAVAASVEPSPTPPLPTRTSVTGCRDVSTVTLADLGQVLCVQGVLLEKIENPGNFMAIFSVEPGAFYWVSYDLVWSQAEIGTCYQTSGEIQQILSSPVLIFGYNNLPQPCP